MRQLLERSSGSAPPPEHGDPRDEEDAALDEVFQSEPESPAAAEPSEFRPRRSAPEQSDKLQAMREIAVESAEQAITHSEKKRNPKVGVFAAGGLVSLAVAAAAAFAGGTMGYGVGGLALLAAGYFGFRAYAAFQRAPATKPAPKSE